MLVLFSFLCHIGLRRKHLSLLGLWFRYVVKHVDAIIWRSEMFVNFEFFVSFVPYIKTVSSFILGILNILCNLVFYHWVININFSLCGKRKKKVVWNTTHVEHNNLITTNEFIQLKILSASHNFENLEHSKDNDFIIFKIQK